MRYLNWDVLLFPNESRVPMQEFKTGCYVVQDREVNHDDIVAASTGGSVFRQVPVVASFVANQTDGSPFRVSVHSWELPEVSESGKLAKNFGKVATFEFRVFIDGICAAVALMEEDSTDWPHIIDESILIDKHGNRDHYLRWPKFHSEMLTQSHWNAGESLGRIKVIISEGFKHNAQSSPFVRLRNIVCFSFQHAPQHILESTGIAWPNRGMWLPPVQALYTTNLSPIKNEPNMDLHAHSPRRHATSGRSEPMVVDPTPLSVMGPPSIPGHPRPLQDGLSSSQWATMADPFVEHRRRAAMRSDISMPDVKDNSRRGKARSSEQTDTSMPDYLSGTTSHSASLTQGSCRLQGDAVFPGPDMRISPPSSKYLARVREDQETSTVEDSFAPYAAIIDSPILRPSGLSAPANTRVSSAANTPPTTSRHSSAADARVASYILNLDASISQADSQRPAEDSDETASDAGKCKHKAVPIPRRPSTGTIKSRKEGTIKHDVEASHLDQRKPSFGSAGLMMGEQENTPITLSEGKRKRAATEPRTLSKSLAIADPNNNQSPSRKVSRKTSEAKPLCHVENGENIDPENGISRRSPLSLLDSA